MSQPPNNLFSGLTAIEKQQNQDGAFLAMYIKYPILNIETWL